MGRAAGKESVAAARASRFRTIGQCPVVDGLRDRCVVPVLDVWFNLEKGASDRHGTRDEGSR